MDKTEENAKPRRPRRSKADIENAIESATIVQIKKKGFAKSQVTDIVKHAKIEPIVFYNRYKNLNDYYEQFVKRYDNWILDLEEEKSKKATSSKDISTALISLLRHTLDNAIVTELMRWEIGEDSQITRNSAAAHEKSFEDYINDAVDNTEAENDIDIKALSALLSAGIFYMVLHKDRSTFAGIDLNTPEGCARIEEALRQIGKLLGRGAKR